MSQQYLQYTGSLPNVRRPATPAFDPKMKFTNLLTSKPYDIAKRDDEHDDSASSSAVASSSASNHSSFAMSERNDEHSESDSAPTCSSSCTHSSKNLEKYKLLKSPPHRLLSSGSAKNVSKFLTEASVKLNELHNPPMSTHERVMYWKIADEFSEIENDFDDTMYRSQPIRSERVSIYLCIRDKRKTFKNNFPFVFLMFLAAKTNV